MSWRGQRNSTARAETRHTAAFRKHERGVVMAGAWNAEGNSLRLDGEDTPRPGDALQVVVAAIDQRLA
jgi:hypothetical protein